MKPSDLLMKRIAATIILINEFNSDSEFAYKLLASHISHLGELMSQLPEQYQNTFKLTIKANLLTFGIVPESSLMQFITAAKG